MAFANWLCRVVGRRRDSMRVWHDELDFRSRGRRCEVEDEQATVEALDVFFEGLRQRRLANEAILKLPHDADDAE